MQIDLCLAVVHKTLNVPPEQIMGPKRGGALTTRARAVTAYLASTECGMSDQTIADHMKRDRASVTHMLKLIESIRDDEKIDAWLDQVTTQALNPPRPCDDTLQALLTIKVDDLLAPKPSKKRLPALPYGAESLLADLARQHNKTAQQLVSEKQPAHLRHESWRILYAHRTKSGKRVFSIRRIAALSGYHFTTVREYAQRHD
jgi:hypothetical protein